MNVVKFMAIILIVVGLVGLVYGHFDYTRETQAAKLGTLELSVKETQPIIIPVWLGVGVVVAGGGLLLFASRN